MTKGPEIVSLPPGATIHVKFTSCEEVYRRVNGVPVPEPPDRGYNPDAFVVLSEDKARD